MTTFLCSAGRSRRVLCLILASMVATGPSVALAQTNAAAMSVRQRFEGSSPEGPESQQPQGAPGPGQAIPPGSEVGKIDLRYVSPTPAAVIVIRPAQILSAPIAQMLPVEIANAYLGFDPAEIEEIVAFADPPTAGLNYGVTFKFKNPVRASSIPQERRDHVQLAELGGKKYLKSISPSPMLYSLYAPNNRTLIAATEAALQQLVASVDQPKSGPMIDRLRESAAGTDVFMSVDVTTLRPVLALITGGDPSKATPPTKQALEMLNQISGAELTLNISNPGPSSLIVRCTDDGAAQKLESLLQEVKQMSPGATQTEQPGMLSPISQAAARYRDRLSQLFPLQREGANYTVFRVDGQNPGQQQFVAAVVVLTSSLASMLPSIWAARAASLQAQGAAGAEGPQTAPGAPGSPEAGQPQ
jgi:hypothetical protein